MVLPDPAAFPVTRCFLLIRLFQQATRGRVMACRAQRFRKTCINSSHSLPLRRRAKSICSPAVGRTALSVHDVGAEMLMN